MKNKSDKNFLDFVPKISDTLVWKTEENGLVTLELENKGAMNKIAQKLFKKPKVSYIHLDEKGSKVWLLIDGEKSVFEIGENIANDSNCEIKSVLGGLVTFLKTLKNYNFIEIL